MRQCLQFEYLKEENNMKITLQVNGREMTFSEDELVAILKSYFSTCEATKLVHIPAEGKKHEVNLTTIDRELFANGRNDYRQEKRRRIILDVSAGDHDSYSSCARRWRKKMPFWL